LHLRDFASRRKPVGALVVVLVIVEVLVVFDLGQCFCQYVIIIIIVVRAMAEGSESPGCRAS
jgi:hypothetical protein